jgi:predicted extracellular nuclease
VACWFSTELARPGSPEAAQIAAADERRRILLDDGLDSSRSAANRPYLSPTTPVRVGDELSFASPTVLGYGFGQWRLQPADGTAEGTFTPQNTRPEAPVPVAGDIQIGAFNVLNYFLTLNGDDARGATSPAEFEEQAAKIVSAIERLGAEVVTLMEIEDTDSTGYSPGDADRALADLVGGLNDEAGYDKWAFVPLPDELYGVDRDVIIYQPDTVDTVGQPVGLVDESVWTNAREPIAQTFSAEGDVFTVVANHFKSKGSGSGENADQGDGQGASNPDRVRQAASLATFAEALRTSARRWWTRSPTRPTGTSTRWSRSPTSTPATPPCTPRTPTAPATTIPSCWASPWTTGATVSYRRSWELLGTTSCAVATVSR